MRFLLRRRARGERHRATRPRRAGVTRGDGETHDAARARVPGAARADDGDVARRRGTRRASPRGEDSAKDRSAKDSTRSADRSAATLDDPSVWIPSSIARRDEAWTRATRIEARSRIRVEDATRRNRDEETRGFVASSARPSPLRIAAFATLASRRRAHAPLAEILLPAALADLAAHHAEGGRRLRVSAGGAACLKSDGEDARGVVRAMLSALDAVRARRVAALQRPATTKSHSRSQEKGDGRGSAGRRGTARGAADGAPASPEARRRAYWVDVDYLVAAAAALARVPLTAALPWRRG